MDRSIAETFIDALEARQGIVAVVGAGGKKSTMHRLVEAHRAIGTRRIALTTTVKMARAPASLTIPMLVAPPETVLSAVRSDREAAISLLMAAPSTTTDRLSGLPPALIQRLHIEGRFDITLVKADGARMRMIKAPNDDEPLLPEGTTTVLPIVSARVFGQTISTRIAHRPERLLPIIDDLMGVEVKPSHVARLLVSANGALHRVGLAHIVPIINMVDSPARLKLAREAAKAALSATDRYDRIILTSMSAAAPLVEIVSRS
jgi:probable selenium-dependent hydroxylase accessory protein YqeC